MTSILDTLACWFAEPEAQQPQLYATLPAAASDWDDPGDAPDVAAASRGSLLFRLQPLKE